jgi:lysozyme
VIEGIDVSKYQDPEKIDWVELSKHISFIYVKATDGVGSEDKRFRLHVAAAKSVGIKVGAYHYLRVRHGKPADYVQQADEFCALINEVGIDLIPALDVETDGNTMASGVEIIDAVRTFLTRVEEKLGVKALLYTYPSFWSSHKELMDAIDMLKHQLWIAHYTTNPAPIVPRPWAADPHGWTMWQYAAGAGNIGRIPGVPGVIDRDRINVSLDDISMPKLVPQGEQPEAPSLPTTDPQINCKPQIESPSTPKNELFLMLSKAMRNSLLKLRILKH